MQVKSYRLTLKHSPAKISPVLRTPVSDPGAELKQALTRKIVLKPFNLSVNN